LVRRPPLKRRRQHVAEPLGVAVGDVDLVVLPVQAEPYGVLAGAVVQVIHAGQDPVESPPMPWAPPRECCSASSIPSGGRLVRGASSAELDLDPRADQPGRGAGPLPVDRGAPGDGRRCGCPAWPPGRR
jgi:hypothetical protein